MGDAKKIDKNEDKQKEESRDVSENQVDESKGSRSSLARLKSFVTGAGKSSESSSERDGAFSYSGEVHAFGIGAGVGVASTPELTLLFVGGVLRGSREKFSRDPHLKDAIDEPAYSLAGYFVGQSVNNSFSIGQVLPQLLGMLPV